MKPRMQHPVQLLPATFQALTDLSGAATHPGLAERTVHLVHLRASQINGCSVCVDMHARMARRAGESDERLFAVAAWREAPWFDDAERVALALTEALTRLADAPDAVPDALWEAVRRHYYEEATAALLLQIAQINVWNRLNAATRQVAGSVPLPA